MTSTERPDVPRLRYIRASGETFTEMRNHVRASPLYKHGDCILVWVNEGDFWLTSPTDVEAEEKDRAEYERLKAKFGGLPK